MAEIKGTNVAAPIVPFTDQDIYATHEAKYGKGGWRSVETLEDLKNIPEARLEEGMFVFVNNDPDGIHSYQWLNGKWQRSKISQGIPIYTQELIDGLDVKPESDTYISIPDPSDLDGEITENTYKTSVNGNYVDVLFRAIRQLQAEVAKLKNTFNYGIESYTGTTTAMTAIKEDLDDAVMEEPLWAIMEGNLSELIPITLGEGHPFTGENIHVIVDEGTYDSYVNFEGYGAWIPTSSGEDISEVISCTDSKLFLYLITDSMDIAASLNLYNVADGSTINSEKYRLIVNYNNINLPKESERGLYNILLVISRKQKMSDGKMYGNNFIWTSIGDAGSGKTLTEGYWNDDELYDEMQTLEIDTTVDGNDVGTYSFEGVAFNDLTLSKFSLYSKYQDFSNEVIPSRPDDETYKYKAAHITVRSVDTQATLVKIKDQLLNNELIFVEDTKILWIKSNNLLTQIAGGGSTGSSSEIDTGMTTEEMIEALSEMGIIQEENGNLSINNISEVTFIHEASGKRFKFEVTEDGELHSQEIADDNISFENKIKTSGVNLAEDVRGFIGQVRTTEAGLGRTSDAGLYSDRLKIGSFYAPFSGDLAHGCSHSYVELENTSDIDISLKGFYLHYTRPNSSGIQMVYHLPLTGYVPAGGTYLIRGKQHVPTTDANVFIKVETFDQEWFENGEAVSFEINENIDISSSKAKGYGFCLTYDEPELAFNTQMVRSSVLNESIGTGSTVVTISASNKSTYPYVLNPHFVDGIYYYKMVTNDSNVGYWATTAVSITSNTLYRNTFELDPAKQAFQAFTTKDSSRARWANAANDIQVVDLSTNKISFPYTEDTYDISNYTPKASFEHKNVSTDKTKLDPEKPNMVTTSFGIDIYKTRCFNWISVGYFDEYVWIKPKTASSWSKKFKSYLPIQCINVTGVDVVSSGSTSTTTITFNVLTKGWKNGASLSKYLVLTDSKHEKISDLTSITYSSSTGYTTSVSSDISSSISKGTYYLHSSDDDLYEDRSKSSAPYKKFFNADVTNNIYARLTGRFPGDDSYYTSHKAIIDIVSSEVSSPTEYVYVVGRADKNGNPDPEHSSDEMSFTLYPTTYKTRIYQTTDQQGFHWIEYQVWASVAKTLNERIANDTKSSIIPILMNTGDMTQNGTRINEWYDYYQAGRVLFDHLEQMYVVGNNDLCGTDPSLLGTGDDNGKSNSFYFHLFYCYEVGDMFEPLVQPTKDTSAAPKYIPSLYYFDSKTDRFLMVNSEITETNCRDWFKLLSSNSKPVNIYTGYEISGSGAPYVSGFTTIYTMLYRTLKDAKDRGLKTIVACHEMPYTVITSDSLLTNQRSVSRSLSKAGALVGSHLNQISKVEVNAPGIYWFSRLLEYYGVTLVLGGHKHTYSCTYPVRENYTYEDSDGNSKNSKDDGPMTMPETLETDTSCFKKNPSDSNSDDLSKFPLTKRADAGTAPTTSFYPYTSVPTLTGGVTYFMCQASGYKLTSNKELPSSDQKFSRIIPQTKSTYNQDTGSYTDTADANQKHPMLGIIDVASGSYAIKLARIKNIFSSGYKFNQANYGTAGMSWEWLTEVSTTNYGSWGNTEATLFSL